MLQHARHEHGPKPCVVVVSAVAAQLMAASEAPEEVADEHGLSDVVERVEYFPISAKTGEGTAALVDFVKLAMPESPFSFEDEVEAAWVAELVREQLVRKTRGAAALDPLPAAEFEWPHILVEILVERESQGMVIGKGSQLLKDVGIAGLVGQVPEGCYLR